MNKKIVLTSILLLTLFLLPLSTSELATTATTDADAVVLEIAAARTREEARVRAYSADGQTISIATEPVTEDRELPPLKKISITKEHSMYMQGCVAKMPAPFNDVKEFYRDVVDCATGQVLEHQLIITNGDYCNFRCRNRYREHCINDGTFDKYYVEKCPGITIPTPGIEPKKITDLKPTIQISDENTNALTSDTAPKMQQGPIATADEAPIEKKLQETNTFTAERAPEKQEKIFVDENSDMYNPGCQTKLTAPFNQVKKIERMVYSCADDTELQKQEIYTNGDFCEFYCIDMKTEMCVENGMDVYYREECGLSGEQVQMVEEFYRKIRIHYAEQEQKLKITVVKAKEEAPTAETPAEEISEAVVDKEVQIRVEEKKMYAKKEQVEKQIGVMPDLAEEIVEQEKKQVREMELSVNTEKQEAIYEIRAMEKAKLFAIIPVEKPVEVELSAETAEIKEQREPFWSFLTTKSEETA